MLYAIIATDTPGTLAQRQAARPDHLARLQYLKDEGRLILAGPHPSEDGECVTGSLVVAEFDSLQAARDWASADPYQSAGVYAEVIVNPFKQVFP